MRWRFAWVGLSVLLTWSLPCTSSVMHYSGGTALRFLGGQNDNSQAVITRVFKDHYFDNGITVMYWFLPAVPGTAPYKDGTTKGYPGILFSIVDAATLQLYMYCVDYDVGVCVVNGRSFETNLRTILDVAPKKWVHMTVSWNAETKTLLFLRWIQGEEEPEIEILDDVVLTPPKDAYFQIAAGQMIDTGLVGELDEFCILSRGVNASEAKTVAMYGDCDLLPGAELYYKFDDMGGSTFDEKFLYDQVQKRVSGLGSGTFMVGSDRYEHCSGHGYGPVSILSTSPVRGTAKFFLRSPSSGLVHAASFECDNCGGVNITSAPSFGVLCIASESQQQPEQVDVTACSANQLQVGDIVLMENASQLFYLSTVETLAGQADSVSIEILGDSLTETKSTGELRFVTSTPILVQNSSWTFKPEEEAVFFLPPEGRLILQSDNVQDLRVEILGITGDSVDFFDCDGCIDAFLENPDLQADFFQSHKIVTFPWTVQNPLRQILYWHKRAEELNPSSILIEYRLIGRFHTSNVASISIEIEARNRSPTLQNRVIEVEEGSSGELEIMQLLYEPENDDVVLYIEEFPRFGKLVQHLPSDGKHVKSSIRSAEQIAQWVIESEENAASSCYSEDFCLSALVGEPNVFPSILDLPTYQPAEGKYMSLWILVVFSEPVFPHELVLYENWSPGGTVKIDMELFDAPGMWKTIWVGANRQRAFCPEQDPSERCAAAVHYDLCKVPYRTRKVKLYMEMDSNARFASVDSIQLYGTKGLPSSMLSPNATLLYEPPQWYFGFDSFSFSVLDCPHYWKQGRLRPTNDTISRIDVTVLPKDDEPVLSGLDGSNLTKAMVHPLVETNIKIWITDKDGVDKSSHELQILPDTIGGRWFAAGEPVPRQDSWYTVSLEEAIEFDKEELARLAVGETIEVIRPRGSLKLRFQPDHCLTSDRMESKISLRLLDKASQVVKVQNLTLEVQCALLNYPPKIVENLCKTFAFLNIFLALAMGVILLRYRKHVVFRAAQVEFLGLICLGAIISSSTVLPITHDDRLKQIYATEEGGNALADASCKSVVWLYCLGFMISLAPLFLKMKRINEVLKPQKVSDMRSKKSSRLASRTMLLQTLALCSVDIFLCFLWTVSDPLTFKRKPVVDGESIYIGASKGQCEDDGMSSVFVPLIGLYHFAILAWGVWLCSLLPESKSQQMKDFLRLTHEGRFVRVAILGDMQVLLVSVPLSLVAELPVTTIAIRSGVILLQDFSILALLFVPKLLILAGFSSASLSSASSTDGGGLSKTTIRSKKVKGRQISPSTATVAESQDSHQSRIISANE